MVAATLRHTRAIPAGRLWGDLDPSRAVPYACRVLNGSERGSGAARV
jgi:hypothetical protein